MCAERVAWASRLADHRGMNTSRYAVGWTETSALFRECLAVAADDLHVSPLRYYEHLGREENAGGELCGTLVIANLRWLRETLRRFGPGALAFIAFHEVGHVADCSNGRDDWEREMIADWQAGRLLGLLGQDIAPAFTWLLTEADCGSRCTTHPPATTRMGVVKEGYYRGVVQRLGW